MARPIRIEYPGAWYHITCRGNERRSIFWDDADRQKFLKILASSIKLYHVEVHVYVLMINHFHLILTTREANLRRFMQWLNTSYAVYFNRRHKRSGHLFRGRYKGILIDADSYLLELSRYVNLNPVRMKKQTKLSIEDKWKVIMFYGWSSFLGYTHLLKRQGFVSYSMILDMLTGKDNRRGRKTYGQFVFDGIAKDMKKSVWEDVRGQAVLGSESFVDYIYEQFFKEKRVNKREQPGVEELKKHRPSLQQ